jgi:beta-N-acetylhexosaminidase
MKLTATIFGIFKLLLALALIPVALDWRSALLTAVRPWAFIGIVGLALVLILAEIAALRKPQPRLRTLSTITLMAAVFALTVTLTLEARFRWARYQVLHADPKRLEELGKHVIVGYRSLGEARELVKRKAIAGVFLSGHNVRGKSVAQVRKEIESLQALRKEQGLPPLWIATDQEGGVVSRLSPPLSRQPSLSDIVAQYPDPAQRERAVREFGSAQGRELAGIGVNLNFAPVVDVNHRVMNPNDRYTRIFERAISNDPEVVAQVAGWYCAALEQAGVRCTLKHFPGLGRVFDDTHMSGAKLTTPVAELAKTDWAPFRALMGGGKVFTMLGHVRLTQVDADRPVSMSQKVISGVLRGDWRYEGPLITDDFCMRAVYCSNAGIENGSAEAINSGVDLILVSWDPDLYYRAMYGLLKADEQGTLSREALKRSEERLERNRPMN